VNNEHSNNDEATQDSLQPSVIARQLLIPDADLQSSFQCLDDRENRGSAML